MDSRQQFLIKMYEQMFLDINRHIMVVWQSVGVLIGAFAVFTLVEKNFISLDIATSIVLLLTAWLIAHLLDASYWYNRNLIIISNIERQFLNNSDLSDICYYFGAHRPKNKMIEHLRIQLYLGGSVAFLVLLYHFCERVAPGLSLSFKHISVSRCIPYLIATTAAGYLLYTKRLTTKKYAEFLENSPGAPVANDHINYGKGHGH